MKLWAPSLIDRTVPRQKVQSDLPKETLINKEEQRRWSVGIQLEESGVSTLRYCCFRWKLSLLEFASILEGPATDEEPHVSEESGEENLGAVGAPTSWTLRGAGAPWRQGMRWLLTQKAPDDSGMLVRRRAHTQPSHCLALEYIRRTAVLILCQWLWYSIIMDCFNPLVDAPSTTLVDTHTGVVFCPLDWSKPHNWKLTFFLCLYFVCTISAEPSCFRVCKMSLKWPISHKKAR